MKFFLVDHFKMNRRKKFFFFFYPFWGISLVMTLIYYFSEEVSGFLYFIFWALFYIGIFLISREYFYPSKAKLFTYKDKVKILENNEVYRVNLDEIERIKVEFDLISGFIFTFAEIKLFLDKKYVIVIRGKKNLENFKKQLEEWYLQKYQIDERTKEGAKLFLLKGRTYEEIQEIKKRYGINWI